VNFFSPLELLRTDPIAFLLLIACLVEAIALHEYAHARMADFQGDRLPRAMGRLSLNPARHLDPIGTLCLILVGFGWGRPVEFRPTAFSSRRFGAALVALAGPLMNLFLAIAGAFTLAATSLGGLAGELLFYFVTLNVVLAVFNLIPLPPLDGSRLLTVFLPPSKQHVIFWLDRYGFLVLLVLVFFGGSLLGPLFAVVQRWVLQLAGIL
jgi:Zn-dependent protease